jgi:AraC family transcriptional regulator
MLLIPPDTLHTHPAFGASALLFLEPESIEWAHFAGRVDGRPVPLTFNRRLRTIARRAAAGDALAARSLVEKLIGRPASSHRPDDALIRNAREFISQRLNGPITLARLAHAMHRSPSRLAHRFREATGVPLRRYVLWRRLRVAGEAAMRGSTLTAAAHAAGFADSAHLSRTFRSMFGVTPSFLFRPGRARVTFLDTATSIAIPPPGDRNSSAQAAALAPGGEAPSVQTKVEAMRRGVRSHRSRSS